MKKRLYKDKSNALLSGVLSGLSEYLNIDVTVVRVVYALLSICLTGFPGIIIYIVLAIVMPDKSELSHEDYDVE